jgi:hypothetical protein
VFSRSVHCHQGKVELVHLDREPAISPCLYGSGAAGFHFSQAPPESPQFVVLAEVGEPAVLVRGGPVGPPEIVNIRIRHRLAGFIDNAPADFPIFPRLGPSREDKNQQ